MGYEDRKRQEKEIKRRDIIAAAERIFFTKGYENTSMDEVAKEAEFSKRTLYVYFSSKEQLYFEIMIKGYRLLIGMLEESFQKEVPKTAAEELHCIFFTFYSFSERYSDYFKSIIQYETTDCEEQTGISYESKVECYQLGEQVLGYLLNALQRGMLDGTIQSGLDYRKTALILWAFTIGVFNASDKKSGYLKNYHHISAKEFIDSSFDLVMKLIAGKE